MEPAATVVVYFQGITGGKLYSWYRIEFETKAKAETEKDDDDGNSINSSPDDDDDDNSIKIRPVATLDPNSDVVEAGYGGRWAVIIDDLREESIYFTGGYKETSYNRYACMDLLIHTNGTPPCEWETVSSMTIPRAFPFVSVFGEDKQSLCVLGGRGLAPKKNVNDGGYHSVLWKYWGEIYCSTTNTWTIINVTLKDICDFDPSFNSNAVTIDEDHGYELAFYKKSDGSLLFYNESTDSIYTVDDGRSKSLALSRQGPLNGLRSFEDSHILLLSARTILPVFTNRSFYWFTYDLRLFAYDTITHTWLQSPHLTKELHPLKPHPASEYALAPPLLLGLPKGKLVLIIQELDLLHFTIACLATFKEEGNSLRVSVEYIQRYSTDDDGFMLRYGQALLKNTVSDTMHGQLTLA